MIQENKIKFFYTLSISAVAALFATGAIAGDIYNLEKHSGNKTYLQKIKPQAGVSSADNNWYMHITNKTSFTMVLTSATQKQLAYCAKKPLNQNPKRTNCYETLKPTYSQNMNIYHGRMATLSYNFCKSLAANGKDCGDDGYEGHININISSDKVTATPGGEVQQDSNPNQYNVLLKTPPASGGWNTGYQNNLKGLVMQYQKPNNTQPDDQSGAYCSDDSGSQKTCSQQLGKNESQHIKVLDNNGRVDKGYNLCESITSDGVCKGWKAYVTVRINHASSSVTPGDDTKSKLFFQTNNIKLAQTSTEIFSIKSNYDPSDPTPQPQTSKIHLPDSVQTYTGNIIFRGVNLAGADFANSSEDPYHLVPYAQDGSLFFYQGANTVRIPVLWEYLIGQNTTDFDNVDTSTNNKYWTNIKTLLTNLLKIKNLNIILDMHDYMRFNPDNVSLDYNSKNTNVIGSNADKVPSSDDYQKIWQSIDAEVKKIEATTNNKEDRIYFELMNEPFYTESKSLPTSEAFDNLVANNYKKAIEGITENDQNRKFIVDGSDWSGLHSWAKEGNDNGGSNAVNKLFKYSKINTNNIIVDVHQYFNYPEKDYSGEFSGTYTPSGCADYTAEIPEWVNSINQWAQNHKTQWMIGEMGIPQYDTNSDLSGKNATCEADIRTLYKNAASKKTFAGFTLWKAGHAWGPATYMNIQPGAVQNIISTADNTKLAGSANPNNQMYGGGFYLTTLKFTPPQHDAPWWPNFYNKKEYNIVNDSDYDLYALYHNENNGDLTHDFRSPFSSIIPPHGKAEIIDSVIYPSNTGFDFFTFNAYKKNDPNETDQTMLGGMGYDSAPNGSWSHNYLNNTGKDQTPFISWKNQNCKGITYFCGDAPNVNTATIINSIK